MNIVQLDNLDWGLVKGTPVFKKELQSEFENNNTTYEKFFHVEKGDVVVDVGSNIGLFTLICMLREAESVWCIEPHSEIFETLKKNVKMFREKGGYVTKVDFLKKAVSHRDGYLISKGLFDIVAKEIQEVNNLADGISLSSFLNHSKIEYIDFLKVDCEGGEYDIFNEENKEFIFEKVFKISGEFHLVGELKNRFVSFRDNFLRHFKEFRVESMDGHDIKWWLYDDGFVDYYSRIMIHIDNRRAKDRYRFQKNFNITNHKGQKEWWRLTEYPTLEFTTSIPKNGCVVDCAYCPQRTLQARYKGPTHLSLDNFKKIIDRLPKEIRITFSGFVEPWMNKWTTDMLIYAHDKGHPIAVFTTGVGMTLDDVEKIKSIPFCTGPNAGFCLHVPDTEGIAKHPITKTLIDVYQRLSSLKDEIKGFYVMSMSDVSDEIKPIFPEAVIPKFWSRAGNLLGEAIIKPELQKYMSRVNHAEHLNSYSMTCDCLEELYHNVVLPNGDVSLCCMDYDLKHILGNLLLQDYEEIIPRPYQSFGLCQKCENGISVDEKKFN